MLPAHLSDLSTQGFPAKVPALTPDAARAAEAGRDIDEISGCSTCLLEQTWPQTPMGTTGDLTPDSAVSCEGTLSAPSLAAVTGGSSSSTCPVTGDRYVTAEGGYVLSRVVLGGGATGIVQKGFDRAAGCEVAIKRLQRDSSCPLRFIEIQSEASMRHREVNPCTPKAMWLVSSFHLSAPRPAAGGEESEALVGTGLTAQEREAETPSLHLEGYAAAGSRALSFSGRLAFDSTNEYGEAPFHPNSVEGCLVLVRRGVCNFATKVLNAKRGGATGVIIINTHDYTEEYSLGQPEHPIPSVLIGQLDGEAALNLLRDSQAASAAPGEESITRSCAAGIPSADVTAASLKSNNWLSVIVRTDAEHEAAVCRYLTPHPHIMQIMDACDGYGGETPCVVSELCTGGKISRLPHGAQADVSAMVHHALWALKQMLAGIEHLHAIGVVHRDLKPENLLLTRPLGSRDARLVVIDFGMAALTKSMTVPCGSARYLAPEVVAGRYGAERDIWALGVVAYELLWAEHPFLASSDSGMIKALSATHAIDVPPLSAASDVPDSVCELLRGLLERDPSLRLTAAQALQHPALKDIALPSPGEHAC